MGWFTKKVRDSKHEPMRKDKEARRMVREINADGFTGDVPDPDMEGGLRAEVYGEWMASQFAWMTPEYQYQRTKHLEEISEEIVPKGQVAVDHKKNFV